MVKLGLSVGEWSTEWRATVFTDSENARRVCAARRRSPELAATHRGRPGKASHDGHTHTRLTDLCTSSIFHFVAPQRAASELSRSAIVAAKLRRRRAREPPQKRDCHLANDSAVACSTSSTY